MTLIAILVLAFAIAIVWRAVRLVVKLLLLGVLIALIASHCTRAGTCHSPGARVSPRPARRSDVPVRHATDGRT